MVYVYSGVGKAYRVELVYGEAWVGKGWCVFMAEWVGHGVELCLVGDRVYFGKRVGWVEYGVVRSGKGLRR